jgi:hypothetical protein
VDRSHHEACDGGEGCRRLAPTTAAHLGIRHSFEKAAHLPDRFTISLDAPTSHSHHIYHDMICCIAVFTRPHTMCRIAASSGISILRFRVRPPGTVRRRDEPRHRPEHDRLRWDVAVDGAGGVKSDQYDEKSDVCSPPQVARRVGRPGRAPRRVHPLPRDRPHHPQEDARGHGRGRRSAGPAPGRGRRWKQGRCRL